MTKSDAEQIELEQLAVDAAVRNDPEGLRDALHNLGFVKKPSKLDAEHLMNHVMSIGGWYMEDREIEIDGDRVMKVIESTHDPRSGVLRPDATGIDPGRRVDGPPDGDRCAGRARPAAGEAQLAPDHARVGVRRPAGDRAGQGRNGSTSKRGIFQVPGSRRGKLGHEAHQSWLAVDQEKLARSFGLAGLVRFPLIGSLIALLITIVLIGPGLYLLGRKQRSRAILAAVGIYLAAFATFYFAVGLAHSADRQMPGETATLATA